jgi:hypothetical protein
VNQSSVNVVSHHFMISLLCNCEQISWQHSSSLRPCGAFVTPQPFRQTHPAAFIALDKCRSRSGQAR